LPDYDLSENKTQMTLTGKIIDENFAEILSQHPDLSLNDIFLLDRVQKKKEISDDECRYLKKMGFVEGRKPAVYLSQTVIAPTKDEVLKKEYIRNRGFDDAYYKNLIIEYLLWDKLPDVLDEKKKRNKMQNLIQSIRKEGKIKLIKGKTWVLKP